MIRGPKAPTERDWVKNVAADPRMRIRIAGEIYEGVAVRITDPAEYEAARAGLEKKYELEREVLRDEVELVQDRSCVRGPRPGRGWCYADLRR
jgi:hypothetical protein